MAKRETDLHGTLSGIGMQDRVAHLERENERLRAELAEANRRREEAELRSLIDEKTGLFNSRYFENRRMEEHARLRRRQLSELSLVMIDIDHFKRFNDSFGHRTGDAVLALVAQAVRETIRQIDVACRFGGEEIAVILPGTNALGAWRLAERIREAIARTGLQVGTRRLVITASLGVATHGPADGNADELFQKADAAMYRAKHNGRNQTCSHE